MGVVYSRLFPANRPKEADHAHLLKKCSQCARACSLIRLTDEIPALEVRFETRSAAGSAARMVVWAHGNMESMTSSCRFNLFSPNSLTTHLPCSLVWFWEYPGYGARYRSEKPTERGIREDAREVGKCAHGVAKLESKTNVVFVGYSMGGYAAVVSAGAFKDADADDEMQLTVVLVSAFNSAFDAAFSKAVRNLLAGANCMWTGRELAKIRLAAGDVCVIAHGREDAVVTPNNAELLEAAHPARENVFLKLYDATHVTIWNHTKDLGKFILSKIERSSRSRTSLLSYKSTPNE